MFTGIMGKISVFCSYAREDDALRERVEQALAPLRAEYLIDDWYDNRILPGQHWNSEIGAALDRTRLMLFIVTPDLMASSYVAQIEIPKAIEREQLGRCQVVPIMARQVDWSGSPLASFQALPGQGRWIDDQVNDAQAWAAVAAGIRDVCKRIVDWSNPYRRSSVGDWIHAEQTMVQNDGRRTTLAGTEEVVAKTDKEATVLLEVALPGHIERRTVTMDLTQPYEQGIGDNMRQIGLEVPANFEFSMGPAQYADEAVNIGGQHYETVRSERNLTVGQSGEMMSGSVSTWRSIDVPLHGTVKGACVLPAFQQHQVLLGFGQADAATRKPRLQPLQGQAPNQSGFVPGRWTVQMNAYGAVSVFDMLFYPNGMLQGQQIGAPMPVQQQGQWGFDPTRGLMTVTIIASQMGMPIGQETSFIQFTGNNGGALFAQDAMGRQFQFQRTG
jgi:hypothetical protein